MDIAIKVVGVVIIIMGVVNAANPLVLLNTLKFLKAGKRIYIIAIARLALGILFLISARECRQFWVVFCFGLLFLLSGSLVIIMGPERTGRMIEWFEKRKTFVLRILGVIVALFGAVILYAA